MQYEPGNNLTDLKPDYPLPHKLITVNDIPCTEDIDQFEYMTDEEANQLLDFIDTTVNSTDDLYTALGLKPDIEDRQLLSKATEARYVFDPWSSPHSGRFFHDKLEAETKWQKIATLFLNIAHLRTQQQRTKTSSQATGSKNPWKNKNNS